MSKVACVILKISVLQKFLVGKVLRTSFAFSYDNKFPPGLINLEISLSLWGLAMFSDIIFPKSLFLKLSIFLAVGKRWVTRD